MTKEKKRKSVEINPVTLMAALVSLCALFVSVYQMQLQKNQQYASVWPHLRPYYMTNLNDSTFEWALHVANYGVGPAIIQEVVYEIDGKPLESFEAFTDSLSIIESPVSEDAIQDLIYPGEFLPAGADIALISIKRDAKLYPAFNTQTKKINLRIKYASVYSEEWEVCIACPDNSLNQKLK
jgi:hypothetical protein